MAGFCLIMMIVLCLKQNRSQSSIKATPIKLTIDSHELQMQLLPPDEKQNDDCDEASTSTYIMPPGVSPQTSMNSELLYDSSMHGADSEDGVTSGGTSKGAPRDGVGRKVQHGNEGRKSRVVKKTKSTDSEAMYGYDEQMEKQDKDNETTTGKGSRQDDMKDDVVIEDEDEKDMTFGNSLVDENNDSTLDAKGFIGNLRKQDEI